MLSNCDTSLTQVGRLASEGPRRVFVIVIALNMMFYPGGE